MVKRFVTECGGLSMIVIAKRFMMDDVPVKLVKTWKQAEQFCSKRRRCHATRRDQKIASADIGSEIISYLCVEFNSMGEPIRSRSMGAAE